MLLEFFTARGAGTRTDAKPELTEAQAMAEAKRKANDRSKPAA